MTVGVGQQMQWFEKNRSLFNDDPLAEIYAWLHEANVHLALNNMSGPTGIARFMVYYKLDKRSVVIEDIKSVSLPVGGRTTQKYKQRGPYVSQRVHTFLSQDYASLFFSTRMSGFYSRLQK